jgi:general secretion pathway protein I
MDFTIIRCFAQGGDEKRAGFTLIEALVALTVILAFAAALGPLMFQSRRILKQGDGQVKAELYLRSLLETPFNRTHPETGIREGETAGMRWRIDVEPMDVDALDFDPPKPKDPKKPQWSLYRVKVAVLSRAGQILTAETAQLGQIN